MTRYLLPRDVDDQKSFGKVSIVASKVISAEEDSNNMNYDNVGEIIEYSSVTGRVTTLSTTLGNVDLSDTSGIDSTNSPEYDQNHKKESDTAAVEKITFTPPTGTTKRHRIIRNVVKGVSYFGIIFVIIGIIVVASFVSIKLYRNRKIK